MLSCQKGDPQTEIAWFPWHPPVLKNLSSPFSPLPTTTPHLPPAQMPSHLGDDIALLLLFFHFSQVIRYSTGNGNCLSPSTGAAGNEGCLDMGTFTLPPVAFLVGHWFLTGPPNRKKMLKLTRLFPIALLVNIDIVCAFYCDSSKVGFNFILMKGPWLPTNSILAEVWAQLPIYTTAHSRELSNQLEFWVIKIQSPSTFSVCPGMFY